MIKLESRSNGKPISFGQGSTTFSLVNAEGQEQSEKSLQSLNLPLLIGGGVLAAILLLRKRKW